MEEAANVRVQTGRIVIEPVRQKTYGLRKLFNGITPKNQQEDLDFGQAVGKQAR